MILFDLLLDVASLLEDVHSSTAIGGGSTYTLIDNAMAVPDGWWNGGTIWFHTGALANKTAVVLNYVHATRTISFHSQPSSVAAHDSYSVARGHYNRRALVDAINTALVEMGLVTQVATLTVAADQRAYALPMGASNVVMVETAPELASPYSWSKSYWWREVNGMIEFDSGHVPATVGAPIRVHYNRVHLPVSADSDVISDVIHPARLTWAAAYYAAMQRARIVTNDERLKDFIKQAQQEKAIKDLMYPTKNLAPTPHFAAY